MSTTKPKFTLYSFWRSSSAWRVRVILALKGIEYTYVAVPLLEKKQASAEATGRNPMQQVPTLQVDMPDGTTHFINQSLVIIDFLDAMVPEVPIYSKDPFVKAYEQELAHDIASGIQPLQNLNVLADVQKLGDEEAKMAWARKAITKGLVALEAKLTAKPLPNNNKDISPFHACLLPQLYNARRFSVDLAPFPTLLAIEEHCKVLPAFIAADPANQPDTEKP